MVKLLLMYKHPANVEAFEEAYNVNLALLEKMPGITRRQANMVLGSPAGNTPYYRFLEFYFDSYEALNAAMTSPEGQTAGQHLMAYTNGQVELLFVDVTED